MNKYESCCSKVRPFHTSYDLFIRCDALFPSLSFLIIRIDMCNCLLFCTLNLCNWCLTAVRSNRFFLHALRLHWYQHSSVRFSNWFLSVTSKYWHVVYMSFFLLCLHLHSDGDYKFGLMLRKICRFFLIRQKVENSIEIDDESYLRWQSMLQFNVNA